MASFNKVILVGNLARDPELRHTQGNDLPIARTALAVNHKYKGKEDVMFIDIVVFGKMAETLQAYTTKGSPLLVEGRLSQNIWEQDGQKRSRHEIIVTSFQFLGQQKPQEGKTSLPVTSMNDEDIPF